MRGGEPYVRATVLTKAHPTLHATRRIPHGTLRLVLVISTLSVNTRRTSSRHCRDPIVYCHATAVVHDIE